jgi:hypothetical protein
MPAHIETSILWMSNREGYRNARTAFIDGDLAVWSRTTVWLGWRALCAVQHWLAASVGLPYVIHAGIVSGGAFDLHVAVSRVDVLAGIGCDLVLDDSASNLRL